jgi:uncharacterized protein
MREMIDLDEKQQAIVQQVLKQYLPNYPVFVFGSRAHGKAKKFSDLDLMIRSPLSPSWSQLSAAREALEDSTLPITVDLVDWNCCSAKFQSLVEPYLKSFST